MRVSNWLLFPGVVSIAACSGGGGGGTPEPAGGTLSSGTYDISRWVEIQDGCALMSNRNGDTLSVVVNGTSLDINGVTGVILASNLEIARASQVDFSTDPFGFGALDCLVTATQALDGLCKGDDRADLVETQGITTVSGTECVEAAAGVSGLAGETITFPCHSESNWRITKQGT